MTLSPSGPPPPPPVPEGTPDPTVIGPHMADEDPELFMGDVTPDPWDDDAQTDWPNA